jgi:hypothetical protein
LYVGNEQKAETWKFFLVTDYSVTYKLNSKHIISDNLLAENVYVGFRSYKLDKATKNNLSKKLKNNNIDDSHMFKTRADHCQQVEQSKEVRQSA